MLSRRGEDRFKQHSVHDYITVGVGSQPLEFGTFEMSIHVEKIQLPNKKKTPGSFEPGLRFLLLLWSCALWWLLPFWGRWRLRATVYPLRMLRCMRILTRSWVRLDEQVMEVEGHDHMTLGAFLKMRHDGLLHQFEDWPLDAVIPACWLAFRQVKDPQVDADATFLKARTLCRRQYVVPAWIVDGADLVFKGAKGLVEDR